MNAQSAMEMDPRRQQPELTSESNRVSFYLYIHSVISLTLYNFLTIFFTNIPATSVEEVSNNLDTATLTISAGK